MRRPEDSTELPTQSSPPTFNAVFNEYRKRTGQSLTQLAKSLYMDTSPLSMILSGKKEPPITRRSKTFYDKLRDLPDITPEELSTLITTHDVPRWVVPEVYGLDTKDYRIGPRINIHMEGVELDVQFRSIDKPWSKVVSDFMHPEDEKDEMAILELKLKLKLRSILRENKTSKTPQ